MSPTRIPTTWCTYFIYHKLRGPDNNYNSDFHKILLREQSRNTGIVNEYNINHEFGGYYDVAVYNWLSFEISNGL